jgi:hypothetical protein
MRGPRRKPSARIALLSVVILLGLGSRRYAGVLPPFVSAYAGDTLWATAAFLGIGLLLFGASTRRIAVLTMTFAVLIEVGQLYKAPWIDSIRRTTLGGLILGYDFVWSDLACYAVGVGAGVAVEMACRSYRRRAPLRSTPGSDRRRRAGGPRSCRRRPPRSCRGTAPAEGPGRRTEVRQADQDILAHEVLQTHVASSPLESSDPATSIIAA